LAPEKIKVIYNSMDFLKEEPSLSSEEELKQKLVLRGKILLTNARLTPWKGVDMLIEIMPRLIEKYNQINLVIIGQGPELSNLKRLTKEFNLENNVFFVGKVSRQKVVDYLGISDLFVLNTNYEGMSHCLLEAMKIGTPIITTTAGGNPETIKDGQTGLLVDYRNKQQWLKAISSILDNLDLAERLVSQAKEDLKRFSWSKLIRETIDIFRECIEK
jgi:glycosyltransferase involved in cell wall biosynthesis